MHPRHHFLLPILVGLLLLLFSPSYTQTSIRFFEGKLEAAVNKAAAEDKIVFVDAYAEWCGPCKWMDAEAFQDPKVGSFFNHHFVAAQIDMEKGEGPDVAERFAIRAYPTLLFLDGKGNLLRQSVGAKDADALLELAQTVVRAAKPELTGKGKPGDPGFVPVDVFTMPDLTTAFERAKAASKLVFVYLPNPYGGIGDPALAKATFSDPQVVAALQAKATCITLSDFGLTGAQFDSLYPLVAGVERNLFAPALLWFRPDGSLAENWFRDVDAPTFLALMGAAEGDGSNTLAGKQARFQAGAHGEEFLYDYLLHGHRAGQRDFEALEAFLPALRGERLLEDHAWDIFQRYRNCFEAAYHDEILPLIPDLIAKYGRDSIVAELHRWRDDEINYFGAIEQSEAFDPGIRRMAQVAHLDRQLQIDLAYLQMLKAAYSTHDAKVEQELLRSADALLDLECNADDCNTLCYHLKGLFNTDGKTKRATLLSMLDLCERMISQQGTGAAFAIKAIALLELNRKEDARRAYQAALASGNLEEGDRYQLQVAFEK